jgi:DNA-binding Lrp family transcriptional regulator
MTLAVSPQSRLGLEGTLEKISHQACARDIQSLPSLRKYKLRVRFASEAQTDDTHAPQQAQSLEITDSHIQAVRALQQDLPNRMRPFDSLARQAGLSCQELLDRAAQLLEARYLRRYAGVLRHRKAGASANVMSVWNPGQADPDAIGRILASSPRVSHCYLRPTRSDWPYGLYAMIHGATRQECLQSVEDLATQTGLDDFLLLWTQKEYAKKRLKLFSPDEARWEESV